MKTNQQSSEDGFVSGPPLFWLRSEGAVVFILSIFWYAHLGASWWRFLGFLLVPDVTFAGYWLGTSWGAHLYNSAHSYLGPLLLAALAIGLPDAHLFPWVLIWTAHIGMDRGMGYGLKYPSGFKRTHLGYMGRR